MRRYTVTVTSDHHNMTFRRRFFTRYFASRYARMYNDVWPAHYRATVGGRHYDFCSG